MSFPHGTQASLRAALAALILPLAVALAAEPATAPQALELTDEPATLAVADARFVEGDPGGALVFVVRLSRPVEAEVRVDYATGDGTARSADGDYAPAAGTLVFAPFEVERTVTVTVHDDARLEGNEWLALRLAAPDGAVLADSLAWGTIANDEGPVFQQGFSSFPPYWAGTLPIPLGDYDGDGFQDMPLYRGAPGSSFLEIPGFRALLADGNYHGGAWCDYDRDGDLDLALLGYPVWSTGTWTPSRLLRNDGPAGFTDVAPALGMDVIGGGETPVWGDFDGDGWPDLFAPYYAHVPPGRSFFYRNNGDGTFTERAVAAGVAMPGVTVYLRPEGAHAADLNGDGALDLYCASHLFLNDGHGNFTDLRAGAGLPEVFDEGAAFADFDLDGDLDLYLRTIASPRLFRNDAGAFTEVTAASGFEPVTFLWGDSWFDAEGDGDLDLVLLVGGENLRLMLNRGDGTFVRDPAFDALAVPLGFIGCADVNRDGDVDLVTGTGVRRVYLNTGNERPGFAESHLHVRVLDEGGYETAHGATVRLLPLEGPPAVQTRVVDGGSGYLSQHEYTVHFGGVGSGRYALEVRYPGGGGVPPVVLDSLDHPLLGPIEPATMTDRWLTVYKDGRVEASGHAVAAVPAVPGTGDALALAGPSPARLAASFAVALAAPAHARLTIHDLHGRLVRTLEAGPLAAGRHVVPWDLADESGARCANGIYFGRLLLDGAPGGWQRVAVAR